MKKIFVLLGFIALIFTSCETNNSITADIPKEEQNSFFLQMQDRFETIGVKNIVDNYRLNNEDTALLNSNKVKRENVKSPNVAAFKSIYQNGTIVYGFSKFDGSTEVILIKKDDVINEFTYNLTGDNNQFILTINNNENIREYYLDGQSKKIIKNTTNRVSSAVSKSPAADCNLLGPRKISESFSACFERNWNNFCCDFLGCMAQITNPHLIAVAITVECSCQNN